VREERLLERIGIWAKEPNRRDKEDTRRIINSILRHLQRILNTKRGNVLIAEDYGVPDFTELMRSYPETIRDMERSIKHMIQKFEPRLKTVRLRLIPQEDNVLSLHFRIDAKLALNQEKVLFETILDSDGKINIKG